jgi:hypothetical protein
VPEAEQFREVRLDVLRAVGVSRGFGYFEAADQRTIGLPPAERYASSSAEGVVLLQLAARYWALEDCDVRRSALLDEGARNMQL